MAASRGPQAIFLGDLVDRGPRIVDTLKLVMQMQASGKRAVRARQHDVKLLQN
jgi:protein phosphatase